MNMNVWSEKSFGTWCEMDTFSSATKDAVSFSIQTIPANPQCAWECATSTKPRRYENEFNVHLLLPTLCCSSTSSTSIWCDDHIKICGAAGVLLYVVRYMGLFSHKAKLVCRCRLFAMRSRQFNAELTHTPNNALIWFAFCLNTCSIIDCACATFSKKNWTTANRTTMCELRASKLSSSAVADCDDEKRNVSFSFESRLLPARRTLLISSASSFYSNLIVSLLYSICINLTCYFCLPHTLWVSDWVCMHISLVSVLFAPSSVKRVD